MDRRPRGAAVIGRRRQPSTYTTVVRAADRFTGEQPGIRTLSCFSAGASYDAENVSFGALVGVDEHLLEPGAGFPEHAHRGVAIVTWVVEGALRHEDDAGNVAVVAAGQAAVQIAGRGVRHVEANASSTPPARFVQTTLLAPDEDEPSHRIVTPPFVVAGALFDVHRKGPVLIEAARAHLYVVSGEFLAVRDGLYPGDSMRMTFEQRTIPPPDAGKVQGTGELLVTLLR